MSIPYVHDATGKKLRKISNTKGITTYIDGIHYAGSSIDFILTEEGKARRSGSSYSCEYDLKDHLGNVRFTFNQHPRTGLVQMLQEQDYYPFGIQRVVSAGNSKYLYNSKELQTELGQLDYGARFYDPIIGRWNVVDPSADEEGQESWTPYHYGFDNPVKHIDPDGRLPIIPII